MRRIAAIRNEVSNLTGGAALKRISLGALAIAAGALMPSVAAAQESVLVGAPIAPEYDRGRNVSVLQRSRPDYDPLGIRRGSFEIFPTLLVEGGATDNVYLTPNDTVGDGFVIVAPRVLARSDWSRHQLLLSGGANLRRYLDETPRNQDEWDLNALGRADVTGDLSLTLEGQAARAQEAPFTGAVQSDVAALSSYQRRMLAARGTYVTGRTRVTLAYDFSSFDFSDITFASGTRRSQADRDRDIHRITGQVEYALSPSLSVFGQVAHADTNYERRLFNGLANRDSDGQRALIGVNFDLSAFIRGSIGAGYTWRNYDSPLYADVDGLSAEARVEYFPTQLTTVTFAARRLLDDSNISNTGAFFDNQVSLRVDHELLNNLLLNLGVVAARQDYVDSPFESDIYRIFGGARYLVSRSVQLQGTVGYAKRSDNGGLAALTNGDVNELSGQIGVTFQR